MDVALMVAPKEPWKCLEDEGRMTGMSTDNGTEKPEGFEGQGRGKRARPRRYKEVEIDWEGIADDLKSARPRQLTEKEALERIADELVEQHRRGFTAEQMAEILARRGLAVEADRVREVLRDFGSRNGSEDAA